MNFSIGINSRDINLFHAFYRTSIDARRELARHVLTGEPFIPKKLNYTSRVAEIFNVILKSLGIELRFGYNNEENEVIEARDDNLALHTYDGIDYLCSDFQFILIKRKKNIENRILETAGVIDGDLLEELTWEIMMETEYITGVPKEEYKEQPAFKFKDTVSIY